MKSKVTVLIPTYNHDKYISRCLRSLFSQNLNSNLYEIIVINDGSTDKTESIIEKFKDKIIYIKNKKKLGLPASLNIGIKEVKTPYFVRVDSDDYVNENFLSYLLNFMESNNYMDAIAVDYYLVNRYEKFLKRVDCLKKPIGCGIIFRTDQIIEIGMYDKEFLLYEDKDLMNRFLNKYKIFKLELPLYRYRQHDKNITKNKKNILKFSNKLTKKKLK
jgi:glycosyltransferase involved in cell wall biosynthesis